MAQMANTRNNFFKQNDYSSIKDKDEKTSTSTEHKNLFKTNSKLATINWPKVKDLSSEPKNDFNKTNQKFNTRGIFTGDPVSSNS